MDPNPLPGLTPKHAVWAMPSDQVLKLLESSEKGLGEEKAARRLDIFGRNEVPENPSHGAPAIFLRQFKSPLLLVLGVTGAITAGLQDWTDTLIIALALLVNAALGFWQEYKAETVLRSLKSYFQNRAVVRRAGVEREIDAADLVPGDIIRVSQGERIPADCRLLAANDLEADESILTGESLPVTKDPAPCPAATPLSERSSMLFGGTAVVQGFASGSVVATGASSEFGRIASLAAEAAPEPTPLQRAVNRFTLRSSLALGALTLLLFILGILMGHGLFEMFIIAVAVGISAVPESLPVALTVILAVGMERLARRRGVVRKLSAAESLGSVTLILTDKTGTLTRAQMELAAVVPFGGDEPAARARLLEQAVLTTEVIIEDPHVPPSEWRILGRKMETALVREAARTGVNLPELLSRYPLLERLPFDSAHKYSAVLLKLEHGYRMVLMGAPELLLRHCHHAQGGPAVEQVIAARAATGEKILGVASRDFNERPGLGDRAFHDFSFQGIISFRDPLRLEARAALSRIAEVGVRTVIVTGDHVGTATWIAAELGLPTQGTVVSGTELAAWREDEMPELLRTARVFARVSPEQKLLLARAYRSLGEVVAVTGDGVNDVPALKLADVGVAMGSGTEAAKGAADLVLLDDDFSTLVAAIEEGRHTLNNIRKVIVYLISHSFDELLLIGCAFLVGLPLPLSALQILYLNLFSDSLPAVAFAFEGRRDVPRRRPQLLKRSILDPEMRFLILSSGIFTSVVLFLVYAWLDGTSFPRPVINSFVFAAFGTYTLLSVFSLRSLRKAIWTYNPFGNRKLDWGVACGLALTFSALYFPPVARVMGQVPLSAGWLLAVCAVCTANLAVIELAKWAIRSGRVRLRAD